MKGIKYLIGIDEVGRGPLAGPVVVAALAVSKRLISGIKYQAGVPLRDSKKLSDKQRQAWLRYIKNHPKIFYAAAKVSPKVIDRINITRAANLAATRVFERLAENLKLRTKNCAVFLDGGLYLNKLKIKNLKPKTRTVVRGDEKIPVIAMASIVAKVKRDKLMRQLHRKYPRYDFINNVGYGTRRHIRAIKKFGLSPIHRRSFNFKSW